jgi:hypothetical protein
MNNHKELLALYKANGGPLMVKPRREPSTNELKGYFCPSRHTDDDNTP